MVDLTEFVGESALRASLQKKRDKAQEKLDALIAKANEKIVPVEGEIAKLDALLAVLGETEKPTAEKIAGIFYES